MKGVEASMSNDFQVMVSTTENRGHTPEEVATRCLNRIVNIALLLTL